MQNDIAPGVADHAVGESADTTTPSDDTQPSNSVLSARRLLKPRSKLAKAAQSSGVDEHVSSGAMIEAEAMDRPILPGRIRRTVRATAKAPATFIGEDTSTNSTTDAAITSSVFSRTSEPLTRQKDSKHSSFDDYELNVLTAIAHRVSTARTSDKPIMQPLGMTRAEGKEFVKQYATQSEMDELRAKLSSLSPNKFLSTSTGTTGVSPNSTHGILLDTFYAATRPKILEFGTTDQPGVLFSGIASTAVQKTQFHVISQGRKPTPAMPTSLNLTSNAFQASAQLTQQQATLPVLAGQSAQPAVSAGSAGGFFSRSRKFLQF